MKTAIGEIMFPQQRKRAVNAEKVEELKESIAQIGLLQPVVITSGKMLVAGLHRLEACKQLGWQEIDCIIKDYDELEAELAEIDENLIRAELTVLERGEHLMRRKEIHESKYPEAKAGARRAHGMHRALGHNVAEIISPTLHLRMLEQRYERKTKSTSLGFVMPIEDAEKFCIKKIDLG